MSEFKIGDIVRMTTGEPGEPGYRVEVRRVTGGLSKSSEVSLLTLRTFENSDWTVELISRPAPPLPTKPNTLGWAIMDGVSRIARLGDHSLWELYDKDGAIECGVAPSDIEGFTEAVLIPKELAEQITAWAGGGAVDADRILNDLADHLKGQDDE